MAQAVAPFKYAEQIGYLIDHRLEHLARDVAPAETLGQGDHADGEGGPGNDMVGKPRRPLPRHVDQSNFRRAAANIEQNDAVRVPLNKRPAAGNSQPRFGTAVDDL